MQQSNHKNGFTIIELTVVIVVIAILMSVTIISYNSIVDSSKQSAIDTAVSQIATKLKLFKTQEMRYPAEVDHLPSEVQKLLAQVKKDKDILVFYVSDGKDNACISITNSTIKYSSAWSDKKDLQRNSACNVAGELIAYNGSSTSGSSGDSAAGQVAWTDPSTGMKWSYPVINKDGTAQFGTQWAWYTKGGANDVSGGCDQDDFSYCTGLWSWTGSGGQGEQQKHTSNANGKNVKQICKLLGDGNWRLPTGDELVTAYNSGLRVANFIPGGTQPGWPGDSANIGFLGDELASNPNGYEAALLDAGYKTSEPKEPSIGALICVR